MKNVSVVLNLYDGMMLTAPPCWKPWDREDVTPTRGLTCFVRGVVVHFVSQALSYVNSLGIMHCDVKPENILISNYGKAEVKLIDFGSSCFFTDRLTTYTQSRFVRRLSSWENKAWPAPRESTMRAS